MLGVQQTPNGDALVFLLLFPEYPPKGKEVILLNVKKRFRFRTIIEDQSLS